MKYVKILLLALLAVCAASAVSASGASAALLFFECESVPCLVDAAVTGGKFTVGGTTITCAAGLFKSEEQAARTEALLMLASYSSCKLGLISAEVNMNGCHYTFHTGATLASGTVDIGPAGCGPIKIKAATCEIKVGAQNGLSSVEYVNKIEGGKMVVEVKAKVKGIGYSTNGGFGCPGEGEEAEYNETTIAKGFSGGAQTGVLVLV